MISPTMSADTRTALLAIIEQAILDHPRSAQVEIGVSEIGTPCDRKLAHKLAPTPPVRGREAAWRPTVGTAVHSWLEAALRAENARLGWDRWQVEREVIVGAIGGTILAGHDDVYDELTGTVIDWKVPGITTIKNARKAKHPGRTYRVQAHGYGRGWALLGREVTDVAIFMLPAAGELGDAWYWSEPYDETVITEAIVRADAIVTAGRAIGWDALIPQLPTADDYCAHCPWWMPKARGEEDGDRDLAVSCPGHPGARTSRTPDKDAPPFGRVKTKGSTS